MSNYTPSVGAISCGMLPLAEELRFFLTECSALQNAKRESPLLDMVVLRKSCYAYFRE